jgi:hypothetical protein
MKSAIGTLALLALFAVPAAHADRNGNWNQGGNYQGDNNQGGGWSRPIVRLDPAIPEPTGALVLGVGLLTIGSAARRRATSRRAD